MQVWNVLHAARCKYRTQKWRKKSPSGHHPTTSSGYIFAIKACIDNRKKKLVKQQYLLHMSPQYGELRPTSSWDPFGSLGHPSYFQWLARLGSVTAQHVVVGVSQTLRRWIKDATYVRQGDHHIGHWPTFLVLWAPFSVSTFLVGCQEGCPPCKKCCSFSLNFCSITYRLFCHMINYGNREVRKFWNSFQKVTFYFFFNFDIVFSNCKLAI